MAVLDIFSKREKKLRTEPSDVYVYDRIPDALRVQIVHILRDCFGTPIRYDGNGCLKAFEALARPLRREYGLFRLSTPAIDSPDYEVTEFVLRTPDPNQVMDVVEIFIALLRQMVQVPFEPPFVEKDDIDRTMVEINTRFREHGIGFQYESGRIVRVDSNLLHSQAVKPALVLLAAKEYAGANAEFLKAFDDHRRGDTKGCLDECLKAFESTMKAICTKRGWAFKPTDTAKALIDVCLQNGLIPSLLQSHISGIRATLESGIPTVRNRLSAHGQGHKVISVPPHYASYMLHLTATTIKFLVESEKALP